MGSRLSAARPRGSRVKGATGPADLTGPATPRGRRRGEGEARDAPDATPNPAISVDGGSLTGPGGPRTDAHPTLFPSSGRILTTFRAINRVNTLDLGREDPRDASLEAPVGDEGGRGQPQASGGFTVPNGATGPVSPRVVIDDFSRGERRQFFVSRTLRRPVNISSTLK